MRLPLFLLASFLAASVFIAFPVHGATSDPGNHSEALALETKAKRGNAEAQYRVGLYYYNNAIPPLNALAARHWFSLAAKQGHAPSMYSLSVLSALENDGDAREAHELFLQSALKGYAVAQYSLGYWNERGDEHGRHLTEAYHWYSKAADQNCPEAQMALGYLYDTGHGVDKDELKARQWYQRAERIYLRSSDNGDPEAQEMLAIIYDVGLGVAKDGDQARAWYLKSLSSRKKEPKLVRSRAGMDHEQGIRTSLVAVLETRYLDRISFKDKK